MTQTPTPTTTSTRSSDLDRIRAWLAEHPRSKSALARAAGISPATLSLVLAGRYSADPAPHIDAILGAIVRDDARSAQPGEIPFVETTVAVAVRRAIARAHQDRDIGIFAGRVGIGKTVAIRRYAADQPRAAVIVDAYPGATAPVVLRLLARAAGAPIHRRTVADTTAAIVDALRGSDRVIVVDEAETLAAQALAHLRRISDAAGVGVVLVGTPALLSLVADPDGRFGQITSRIGWWPPVAQAIGAEDAAALAAAFLGAKPDQETLTAIWNACRGSARALRNILRHADRRSAKRGVEIDAAMIAEIDRHAMGGRRLA